MSTAHTREAGAPPVGRAREASAPPGRSARALLVVVELFVGVGAVYGGWNLLTDAEGFGMERSWLDGTPFPDYRVPGLVLLVVIGGGMIAAAALAAAGSRYTAHAALTMGVLMLGFLMVETLLIGYQGAQQVPLVAVIGAAAFVLVAVGWQTLRRRRPDPSGR